MYEKLMEHARKSPHLCLPGTTTNLGFEHLDTEGLPELTGEDALNENDDLDAVDVIDEADDDDDGGPLLGASAGAAGTPTAARQPLKRARGARGGQGAYHARDRSPALAVP